MDAHLFSMDVYLPVVYLRPVGDGGGEAAFGG